MRRHAGKAGQRVDVTRKQSSNHSGQASQASTLSTHPLLVRQLKGHTDHCTAIAFGPATASSQLLAVSSRDRLVRLWQLSDADSGQSEVQSVRMRADFATALCFGDGHSQLYCIMSDTHTVDVYSVDAAKSREQHQPGKLTVAFSRSFPQSSREEVSTARCTATRLLLLMSSGTDSPLLVYSAGTGQLLRSLPLNQLRNNDLAVSVDGRLFAAATKLSDVKVWQVGRDKGDAVSGISHVMTLTGHSKAVQSICFPSLDSACTITADGRLRCFNIAVRHTDGEEPRQRWAVDSGLTAEPAALRCAALPSGWLLAVSSMNEVRLYRADVSGCRPLHVLSDVGGQWGLAAIELRSDGKRLLTVNTSSKTAEVWRVPDD